MVVKPFVCLLLFWLHAVAFPSKVFIVVCLLLIRVSTRTVLCGLNWPVAVDPSQALMMINRVSDVKRAKIEIVIEIHVLLPRVRSYLSHICSVCILVS